MELERGRGIVTSTRTDAGISGEVRRGGYEGNAVNKGWRKNVEGDWA